MDVRLPASGTACPHPSATPARARSTAGCSSASPARAADRPVSARWPDGGGRFTLVLPPSARGKTLRFWESDFQAFSRVVATPGGPVDLTGWPTGLSPRVARDVAFLTVGR